MGDLLDNDIVSLGKNISFGRVSTDGNVSCYVHMQNFVLFHLCLPIF